MTRFPWPSLPVDPQHWRYPPRDYGILPFWFLNGELDAAEMRRQLHQFRAKGMPGVILHGRYGLKAPYLSAEYLDRVKLAVDEGSALGLETWIYDEMNWPSGTADGQVLREHPDLAQRYLECISFTVRGPWFTYLTGADSRYLDFERSTPVAAFAISDDGRVLDLTPNLSFGDVIPWEAPAGTWRLMYLVEKRADYYIDALNPEATAAFLRLGYDPYWEALKDRSIEGFYTDEPAMHYFVTGGDNPIVPWTKDMFLRFQERNGYHLRPHLPDLFFDVRPDSARIRYDFYSTLTQFYSGAYYEQIHAWCRERDVLFTGHLLYEESLRKMIRVEGNPFKHYVHLDVVGVDHLYPIIGNQDRPDEHVAMKLASSAAHHLRSPRVLCESFGGIFMDATMQRMKWITDWQYVLGVNLLNPHGFHYTVEGPRKRDWPPSMFYQYPWWHYYSAFSEYVSRLSSTLSGGRHVAQVGVIWPINSMFATYKPQIHDPLGDRTENDFNALSDLLLRLHHDFDYIDEDNLVEADVTEETLQLGDEAYRLLILPPMTHLQLSTVERLEEFVGGGGRVLGMVFLPNQAFGPRGAVDISERIKQLFGVDPVESQRTYQSWTDVTSLVQEHGRGKAAFLQSYALARRLPARLQRATGAATQPESQNVIIEVDNATTRYYYAVAGERQEITDEVVAERRIVAEALADLIAELITPDVTIDNPEILYLHRIKDGRDVYFVVNPTFQEQTAEVTLAGFVQPVLWNPSTGGEQPIIPLRTNEGRTRFHLTLAPVGSAVLVTGLAPSLRSLDVDSGIEGAQARTRQRDADALKRPAFPASDGHHAALSSDVKPGAEPLILDGEWEFWAEDANALVIDRWLAHEGVPGVAEDVYVGRDIDTTDWQSTGPGAWSYQVAAEPDRPFPIPVWYRIPFVIGEIPSYLALVVDGFAGTDRVLYVNGKQVSDVLTPSAIDSEMREVEITNLVSQGENVIVLRLTVQGATDGLLDLVKLVGPFSVSSVGEKLSIAGMRRTLDPLPWTAQGYPYYSGRGVYRKQFSLPVAWAGSRIFLEPVLIDDVLEIVVNGQTVGIRLWPPYDIEITPFIHPGANTVELRVANTLVNLLEADPRTSGLAGPPRLVARATSSPPRAFAGSLDSGASD